MTMDDIIAEWVNLREWADVFVKEALEHTPEPAESLELA